MERYISGLAVAFLPFPVLFGGGTLLLSETARARAGDVVAVSFAYGLFCVVVLALVIGPIVLGIRPAARGRVSPTLSAATGLVLSPVSFLILWAAFADSNETLPGLISFWMRVPGEFVFGVLPHVIASVVFCTWIARRPIRRREPARSRA